jgi:hypothetical protein
VSSQPVIIDGTYKCIVHDVIEWRHTASEIQCVVLCLGRVGCEYFRYGDPDVTGNHDNCGLTDVAAPVANLVTDPRPEAWYALD